jgi:hypothetical protein
VGKRDGRWEVKEEATEKEFVVGVAPTRSKSRRERAFVLLALTLLGGITTFPEFVRAVTGRWTVRAFQAWLVALATSNVAVAGELSDSNNGSQDASIPTGALFGQD